jgi:hypothetical protein
MIIHKSEIIKEFLKHDYIKIRKRKKAFFRSKYPITPQS